MKEKPPDIVANQKRRVPFVMWLDAAFFGCVGNFIWFILLISTFAAIDPVNDKFYESGRIENGRFVWDTVPWEPGIFFYIMLALFLLALSFIIMNLLYHAKAFHILSVGNLTAGRLSDIDGINEVEDDGRAVSAQVTFEYLVDGANYTINEDYVGRDAIPYAWLEWDYAKNPLWEEVKIAGSPKGLLRRDLNRFLRVDKEELAEFEYANERRRGILSGELTPDPCYEEIFYDPENPAKGLLLRLSYSELEIDADTIHYPQAWKPVAWSIFPIFCIISVGALFIWRLFF
jgi:hypothetical protein